MTAPELDKLAEKLHAAALALGEHFDSVLLIATIQQDGESYVLDDGAGNAFARFGSAEAWISDQQEIHKSMFVRGEEDPEPGSDPDPEP